MDGKFRDGDLKAKEMYLPEDGLKPRELFCWGEKDRDFILRVKWKIELSKDIAGIEERPGSRLKGRPSKN